VVEILGVCFSERLWNKEVLGLVWWSFMLTFGEDFRDSSSLEYQDI